MSFRPMMLFMFVCVCIARPASMFGLLVLPFRVRSHYGMYVCLPRAFREHGWFAGRFARFMFLCLPRASREHRLTDSMTRQ